MRMLILGLLLVNNAFALVSGEQVAKNEFP